MGEALDSVRMQRMTFELEVLVGVTADGPSSKAASFFGGGDFEVLGVPVQEAEGPDFGGSSSVRQANTSPASIRAIFGSARTS